MKYYCNKCKKVLKRKSDKVWIKSYCDTTGKYARLMKQDPWKDLVNEVNRHFKVDKSLL